MLTIRIRFCNFFLYFLKNVFCRLSGIRPYRISGNGKTIGRISGGRNFINDIMVKNQKVTNVADPDNFAQNPDWFFKILDPA